MSMTKTVTMMRTSRMMRKSPTSRISITMIHTNRRMNGKQTGRLNAPAARFYVHAERAVAGTDGTCRLLLELVSNGLPLSAWQRLRKDARRRPRRVDCMAPRHLG